MSSADLTFQDDGGNYYGFGVHVELGYWTDDQWWKDLADYIRDNPPRFTDDNFTLPFTVVDITIKDKPRQVTPNP